MATCVQQLSSLGLIAHSCIVFTKPMCLKHTLSVVDFWDGIEVQFMHACSLVCTPYRNIVERMQNKVGDYCCYSCTAIMRRERANFIVAIFTDVFVHCKLQVMFCALCMAGFCTGSGCVLPYSCSSRGASLYRTLL